MFSLNVEIDSGFYTVKFDSLLLKDAVVEADRIIPPLREEDPLSSDSDLDDSGDEDDMAYAKGVFGSKCSHFPHQSKLKLFFEILPKNKNFGVFSLNYEDKVYFSFS